MKLVNADYGLEIEFQEGKIEVLVIESVTAYRDITGMLWNQCTGESGNFLLSDGKILKIDKYMTVIGNPFDLDFQNRKITTALFHIMSKIGNEKVEEKALLNSQMIHLLENISASVNYSGIGFQLDFEWNDLFKMYGVKIDVSDNFLLRIIEYTKVMSSLCGIFVFCFFNLKNYLTQEELLLFYKEAEYNKLKIILIESFESEHIKNEHITIVDKDLCVIKKI